MSSPGNRNAPSSSDQQLQHHHAIDVTNDRVLSIQSHVVSGYVGNRAAVFPLQLLGFDVDVINSVHFSNHTGYPRGVQGDVLQGEQLLSILRGLQDNGLLDHVGHVLTGYIGSKSFLEAVIQVVETIRNQRGDDDRLRFVCDPVLGDAGQFYVPRELVQVYRDQVLPLANVVTPNQFEVEQLTGITVRTMKDALLACNALHKMGPELVFITSIVLKGEQIGEGIAEVDIKSSGIAIVASQQMADGRMEAWRVDSPLLPGQYTGTGDLCAALLLGHTALCSLGGEKSEDSLKVCMEQVANTMFAVIQRTHEASSVSGNNSVAARELKLIQSKADIENPPTVFKARRIQ